MKAIIWEQIKRIFLLIVGSAILGTLLLTLVFCLPVERMRENVAASVYEVIPEARYNGSNSFLQYLAEERESYTDAIMIQNSVEKVEGKNVYEHAMWAYHYDLDPEFWSPEESLRSFSEDWDTAGMHLHEYSRYWHGYLVYLKPLLLIFTWEQILVLEAVLQLVMMLFVVIGAIKRKKPQIIVAMLFGCLFLKQTLVLVSLTMSVCWVLTLAAILLILFCHEKIEQKKYYPELFLVIGILVGYFDFLTYPIVTLGFPLCICFLLKEKESLKKTLCKVIGYSAYWGIGYAGMWAMKWVIADITLQTGTIKDAIWSIIGRTEAIGGRPRMNGGWYVISLNLQEYDWKGYIILAGVVMATALSAVIIALLKKISVKEIIVKAIPYLVIACIPFLWIIVVQHHSALHARFTFRIISVAVLAMVSMAFSLVEKK